MTQVGSKSLPNDYKTIHFTSDIWLLKCGWLWAVLRKDFAQQMKQQIWLANFLNILLYSYFFLAWNIKQDGLWNFSRRFCLLEIHPEVQNAYTGALTMFRGDLVCFQNDIQNMFVFPVMQEICRSPLHSFNNFKACPAWRISQFPQFTEVCNSKIWGKSSDISPHNWLGTT